MTGRLAPWVAAAALLTLGAGPCGAPPEEEPFDAGRGDVAAPVCTCPAGPATVAHLPLECLCTASTWGSFLCSRTTADLVADAHCGDGKPAFRNLGCSKVSYEPGGGFAGSVFTYRQSGGFPIGILQTGDGPCAAAGVTSTVYGEGLFPAGHPAAAAADACADVTGCVLCGPSDVPGPRCM